MDASINIKKVAGCFLLRLIDVENKVTLGHFPIGKKEIDIKRERRAESTSE